MDEKSASIDDDPESNHKGKNSSKSQKQSNIQRSLPAYARVKQSRVPNAYDKTALRLEVSKERSSYEEQRMINHVCRLEILLK